MRITTSIMIAKAIAAIALTASTAGGIALATRPRRPTHTPRTPSESAAITVDVLPSSLPLTTPGPTDAARADAEEEAEKPPAAQPGEQRTGTRTAIRATPAAKAPHLGGLCRAASSIATDGHPGKAAESPAFANPRRTRAGVRRPGGAGFSQGWRRSSASGRARRSWVCAAMIS